MQQVTGFFIFSFLWLFPLKVHSNVKDPICPSGSTFCHLSTNGQSECVPNDNYSTDCRVSLQALEKKDGTVYTLKEGTMVKCEGDSKLVPLHPQALENSYWICRSPQNIPPSEK